MAQGVHDAFPPNRPLRDACTHCAGFATLIVLGAAAWVGVFLVCSRF